MAHFVSPKKFKLNQNMHINILSCEIKAFFEIYIGKNDRDFKNSKNAQKEFQVNKQLFDFIVMSII